MTERRIEAAAGFDEFVEDRGGALWWAAWLLTGDAHHAEDLVQTALTKTYGRFHSFENDRHFESYVRTTIYRTFVSWWRRRAWRSEVPTEVHPDSTSTTDGDPALREDLLRALATLPRDAFGAYGDQLAFIGPREALTVGVDTAVNAFNDLTWREGMAIDCASNGEVYHLLFEYPDGPTQILRGNFTPKGCHHFDMSGGIVEGADGYLGTLQGLWEAQRASQARMPADADVCPGFTSVFTVDVADLGRGFGCVVQTENVAATNIVTASYNELPEGLLTLIRDGFPTGSEPLDRYEPFTSDEQVVLLTTHGDPLTLYWGKWGDGVGFAWNNPQRLVWYPDEALTQRIVEHFAALSQVSSPQPEDVVTSPASSAIRLPLVSSECAEALDSSTELPGGNMPAAGHASLAVQRRVARELLRERSPRASDDRGAPRACGPRGTGPPRESTRLHERHVAQLPAAP